MNIKMIKNKYKFINEIILIFLLLVFSINIFANDNSIYEIGIEYGINSEPLRWVKIDEDKNDKNKILLITEKIVLFDQFNKTNTGYYKGSSIRYFLNNEFYKKVFSIEERKHIVDTNIDTEIYDLDFYNGVVNKRVENCVDKLFILSEDEYNKYKLDNNNLYKTDYVKSFDDLNSDNIWFRNIYNREQKGDQIENSQESKDYYLKYAFLLNSSIGKKITDFAGIRVCMWYDLSYKNINDDEFIKSENNFIDAVKLDHIKSINQKLNISNENALEGFDFSFNFSNKNLDDIKFTEIKFGNYKNDLYWDVVYLDEETVTLVSNQIIEYIDLDYEKKDLNEVINNPYDFSNVRSFLNNEFLKSFKNNELEMLSPTYKNDFFTIPSFNELVIFNLISKNIKLSDYTDKLYFFNKEKIYKYFLRDKYIYNDIPYLLSFENKNNESYIKTYINSINVDIIKNKILNKNNIDNIDTFCGIRPMIKIKIDEFKKIYTDFKFENLEKNKINYLDNIKFGKYEQDGNIENGKEDIEWVVICINKLESTEKYLLISKNIIDTLDNFCEYEYYKNNQYSSILNFSNTYFLNTAFDEEEKEKIIKLHDENNSFYVGIISDNINTKAFSDKLNYKYKNQYVDDIRFINENFNMIGFRPIIVLDSEDVLKYKID